MYHFGDAVVADQTEVRGDACIGAVGIEAAALGFGVRDAVVVVVGLTAPVTGGADGRTGVAVIAAGGRQNLVAASEQAGGAHRVFIGVGAKIEQGNPVFEAFLRSYFIVW